MDFGVSFGSLTGNSKIKQYQDFKDIKFEDLDIDGDGILSEEEIQTAVRSGQVDRLDLSTIDENADQKVTDEQYVLWTELADMDNLVNTMKEQAARDLIGASDEDLKNFADKLTDFEETFKTTYLLEHDNNAAGMAKAFNEVMSEKYNEIRQDVLSNTKGAVRDRVVKNVIEDVLKEGLDSSLAKLIKKNSVALSSNAKRILSQTMTSEADRFIKSYTGKNLEKDLKEYLTYFLKTSDKQKLADAIGVWDKEFEDETNNSPEASFMKMKNKAKTVLQTALGLKINLKLGDFVVRSEGTITPAIAQFKDEDSLRWGLNKAINQLSDKSRLQEIMERDEGFETSVQEPILDNEQTNRYNIFNN